MQEKDQTDNEACAHSPEPTDNDALTGGYRQMQNEVPKVANGDVF